MARKKILSLAFAAMLSVNSVWEVSPAFYEGTMVKAAAATKAEKDAEGTEVISATDSVDAQVETPTPSAIVTGSATPSVNESWVSASKEDGSSFTTETLDVEVTLNGTTKGTYSVDDGPEKSFESGDSITIGQGKIADRDVTLKISATIGNEVQTKTFTYKKVFDKNATTVKGSAMKKLQSLFNTVADVADSNEEVLSGEPASGYFQTNPNKQTGSRKTIKSASDFTEDMIIAQGVANDNTNIFRGQHEGPIYDSYALFGAYDDENIYLGVQYTNVTDVTASEHQYPQSEWGKPNWADLPQMFAFDTGSGDYTDGSTNSTSQEAVWDVKAKFAEDAKVDNIFMYSAKAEKNTMAWYKVSEGKVDCENPVTAQDNIGITYKYEDGFFCSHMYGIDGKGQVGYTPAELNSDNSNWIDFLTTNHDTKHDTFMTMTIPLERFGMTAKDIEERGIGVMNVTGYMDSAIASLPQDFSMLDNATKPFSFDESSSAEKEDTDIITVPLARLGGTAPDRVKNTPAPLPTPEVSKSPTLPPTPEVSKSPTLPPTLPPTPVVSGPVVTSTPEPQQGDFLVNFGANRSSPQYVSTWLSLKAVAYGSKDYKYEFIVDGKVVQDASEEDYCYWKGTLGTHRIKVVVTDGEGKYVSVEKVFEMEPYPYPTPTVMPLCTAQPSFSEAATEAPVFSTDAPEQETAKPLPTKGAEKTAEPQEENNDKVTDVDKTTDTDVSKDKDTKNDANTKLLAGSLKITKRSPQKAGTTISVSVNAEGGKAPYTYTLEVKDSAGKTTSLLSETTKNTVKWKPLKAGSYNITGKVTDAEGKTVSDTEKYTVSNPIKVKTFKFSKNSIKKGKDVTITAKATSASTIKYQFRLGKTGSKKFTNICKYSKKGTFKWKADKKGEYYIYLDLKDANGNTKTVKKKITIK